MKRLIADVIMGIAFAVVEAGVVVYAREAYYPESSLFPLKAVPVNVAAMELFREMATLIIIGIFAYVVGDTMLRRFAHFLIVFGLWDIFYYIFLYVFYGVPMDIGEPDLLFLIPVVWSGPVFQPVICAILMILLGIIILVKNRGLSLPTVFCLVAGSLLCIFSWTIEFIHRMREKADEPIYTLIFNVEKMIKIGEGFVPTFSYSFLYYGGVAFIVLGIINYLRK